MPRSGQTDQKAPATWTFWDLMRLPILPLIWFYSYFWRGQSIENRKTDACPSNEATKNEQLQIHSSREQEAITLDRDCIQLLTRNRTLEPLCKDKEEEQEQEEQEAFTVKEKCRKLKSRNKELQKQLSSREQEVITLNKDCSQLRTRLSQIAAMQLTEGNPNIADLSDQNRPDKLAEQFSELYDNQWTDCYQVLVDNLGKQEEDSISILLKIVKTSYDICLDECQNILTTTRDILFAFAGRSDEEPDKALDALIQEILHKLKSHRTKSFKAAPTNIGKEIRVKLISKIGEPETDACDCFIEECIRTCWLMCIKDPPMYIFCDQEAVFDKNKYMEYTEMGHKVAYVVWPALYLHKNGPLMRKGVAQGEGKKDRKQTRNAKAATSQLPEPDHIEQYNTGIEDMTKVESDHHQKETQARKSEEMATANDSLIKTDVIYNEDKDNDDKLGYENDTQTESIVENGSWKQKQKDERFRALPEDESTGREDKTDDKLTLSKEYCQERELSGGSSINRQESPGNERRNGNVACSSGQNEDEVSSSGYEPLKKNLCDLPNDAEQDEMIQSTNILISSNNTVNEEGNFQSAPKDEKTESKEQSDNTLVSLDEYCQPRETSGSFSTNEDENQGKETQDRSLDCNNGQEVKEAIHVVHSPLAKNIGHSSSDAEEEKRPLLINFRSSSDDILKEEREEKNSQSSTKGEATQSNEQADNKLVSSYEYCQQREILGAGSTNKEENQGKEKQDGFIKYNNGQEVKEGINIVHAPLATNVGGSSNNAEEQERPQFIDVRSSSDDSLKTEKEKKNSHSSTKGEATEMKEQADNKLVLSNEYCQQRETSGATNINEEENQGKEIQDGFIECNNGQEVKEPINNIHASPAKNIGDSPNDAEEEETPQSINVLSSSDDNWKDEKEKCFQYSTKDEAMESKEQACNINEEENQGKEIKDGFIECINVQEVKEAAHIVTATSDKTICNSPNEAEQDERLKSTNVCSSSDYDCNEDKEEEDVQSSTKHGATESKEQAEHKLLLPGQYCQQRETLRASQINEKENQGWQKEDWVTLCNDSQEVNEGVTLAHESSEKNKGDSSNDTEQENRLSSTINRSSSDDNKNKDKNNADFHTSPSDDGMAINGKEIANVGDSTDKSEVEEFHGKAL